MTDPRTAHDRAIDAVTAQILALAERLSQAEIEVFRLRRKNEVLLDLIAEMRERERARSADVLADEVTG